MSLPAAATSRSPTNPTDTTRVPSRSWSTCARSPSGRCGSMLLSRKIWCGRSIGLPPIARASSLPPRATACVADASPPDRRPAVASYRFPPHYQCASICVSGVRKWTLNCNQSGSLRCQTDLMEPAGRIRNSLRAATRALRIYIGTLRHFSVAGRGTLPHLTVAASGASGPEASVAARAAVAGASADVAQLVARRHAAGSPASARRTPPAPRRRRG
jgi:hypothetical protein